MGRFDTIKTAIDANVNTNGNQEITGAVMNSILNQMVDATDAAMTETDGVIADLQQKDAQTDAKLTELVAQDIILSSIIEGTEGNFTEGEFASQTIITKNGWNVSDYIELTASDNIIWTYGEGSTEYWGFATYDADKNFLNGFNANDVSGQRTLDRSSAEFDNAIYIRASFRDSMIGKVVLQIGEHVWTPLYPQGGLTPQIEDMDIELAQVQNNIRTFDGILSPIVMEGEVVTGNIPISSFKSDSQLNICGKNIFDQDSIRIGRLNDSGEYTADTSSSYATRYIPVKGKSRMVTNFNVERVYLFDADKQLIVRHNVSNTQSFAIPSSYNGIAVEWVQIQFLTTLHGNSMMAMYGDTIEAYEPFTINTDNIFYENYNAWNNDLTTIRLNAISALHIGLPTFGLPSTIYEPVVDEGYSTPRQRAEVKRSAWTASDKYLYYDFLSHYFDTLLGMRADGYRVNKRSLENDSSNQGYEIFEYSFCPKNWTKTVLISAGMNSNEISTMWGVATFVRELMSHEDVEMEKLYNNVRFVIVPFICPSSFDQEPLKYTNHNDVRINHNFNYKDSWLTKSQSSRGAYPDSEVETRMMKQWVNEYAWKADLWIDCHSDDGYGITTPVSDELLFTIVSDSDTYSRIEQAGIAVRNYYVGKGTCTSSARVDLTTDPNMYFPKTRYGKDVCGIPSIMIEQKLYTTCYGSDGNTNNDSYGIINYFILLRHYICAMLSGDILADVTSANVTSYQLSKL